MRSAIEALREKPLISVAMPTYNTPPRYLREAIESVRRQHYPAWELCIVDDGSTNAATRRIVERYAKHDARIRAEWRPENAGISSATNAALALCEGEVVAFLDHDDVLTPDALVRVAEVLWGRDVDMVYSDQDKITPVGVRADPFWKPEWSPTYALGAMYIGHLLAVRRSLAVQVGGFDTAFDTIQDFEFMLRVSERARGIRHVPRILYHWRAVPESIASDPGAKPGVEELQTRAVNEHLRRRGVAARAVSHPSIPHRTVLVGEPDGPATRVSVVVAASGRPRHLSRCLDALLERTEYPSYEVIVVDGPWAGATEIPASVRSVTDDASTFKPARARNLGAREAGGEGPHLPR